jgi:alpha-1,6-mannosyltransferase
VRTYVDAKLRWASAAGHEIIVLAPAESAAIAEVAPGAVIAGIPAPTMPLDRRYRYFNDQDRLHRELTRWRPDHVECSSPWSSASAVARWQGCATRSLVMHCDPMAAYAYRWFSFARRPLVDKLFSRFWNHMRALDRGFDVIVSPSVQLAARLGAVGLGKVVTVPLGVSDEFSPLQRDVRVRAELLAELGLGPSATLLLAVGRLTAEKRPDLLVKVVVEAARARDVGLIMIGDGGMRGKLERIASRSGRIRLLAPIADRTRLAQLMASSDALIHGCEAETFGLVVAEALASGTPVIVPNGGGAFEQLRPGCGLSYTAGSKADLTRAIATFVDVGAWPRFSARRCSPRLLDEHFAELVSIYRTVGATDSPAALCERNVISAPSSCDSDAANAA